MSVRPGFLGGPRQSDAQERDADLGFGPDNLIGGTPLIRLGDPNAPSSGEFNTPPGFDPIWGTLGAPSAEDSSDWLGRDQEPEGVAIDVEVFGNGGELAIPTCFLPDENDLDLEFFAVGGAARIVSLSVYPMRSIWRRQG